MRSTLTYVRASKGRVMASWTPPSPYPVLGRCYHKALLQGRVQYVSKGLPASAASHHLSLEGVSVTTPRTLSWALPHLENVGIFRKEEKFMAGSHADEVECWKALQLLRPKAIYSSQNCTAEANPTPCVLYQGIMSVTWNMQEVAWCFTQIHLQY